MQRIDEYLEYAKEFRAKAADASAADKKQYLTLAEEWERLSRERLVVLEMRLDRTSRSECGML